MPRVILSNATLGYIRGLHVPIDIRMGLFFWVKLRISIYIVGYHQFPQNLQGSTGNSRVQRAPQTILNSQDKIDIVASPV